MIRTLRSYLIQPHGDRYNNEIKIGDKSLILNATIDEKDYKYVNRIGEVVAIPRMKGLLEVGDKVIVHHNVFRKWWNVKGRLSNSGSHVKDKEFSCYQDQIFAFNKGDGWIALEDYCFIKPIKREIKGFQMDFDVNEHQKGVVRFSNPILESQGIQVGDTVLFDSNSEYEFNIDGEVLYKMSAFNDVLCKIE